MPTLTAPVRSSVTTSPHVCLCRNGGLCKETDTGDLTCECPEDFLGRLCEDYVHKTGSPGTPGSGANTAAIVVPIVVVLLVLLMVGAVYFVFWKRPL
uniref:EGF-like domain-containing protein n=1 Tax=Timema bartmani TaxID=61472 RepID=A0A7R9FDD0_9NEOP|nr:unnamed protein product [Timema bartmani]